MQPTAFGARDRCYFGIISWRAPRRRLMRNPLGGPQGRRGGEHLVVQASRDLAPAAPSPTRRPHHHTPATPRRASPAYPARPTSWRWCHQYIPSVVRAAQPAAQADAAARPEDAGHFEARSRHQCDTGVSWRRSLAAIRSAAYQCLTYFKLFDHLLITRYALQWHSRLGRMASQADTAKELDANAPH